VRRREAERRVDASRRELEAAVRDLRRAARRRIDPRSLLRRHPVAALGAALAVGVWLATRSRRSPDPRPRPTLPRTRRTP